MPDELTYVVRGRPVTAAELRADADLAAFKPKGRPKPDPSLSLRRVDMPQEAKESRGFTVTGFSPRRLEEAQRKRQIERQAAIDTNRRLSGTDPLRVPIPPAWDEAHYMATAKPERVNPKPYWNPGAAAECARMAEAAGWKRVTYSEDLRG